MVLVRTWEVLAPEGVTVMSLVAYTVEVVMGADVVLLVR